MQRKKVPEAAAESHSSQPPVTPKPHFVRCNITGPDGKKRPGWEMWLGEHCFGRSDQKESLLQSLERQLQPSQSFHWREVHRQRFARARAAQSQDERGQLEERVGETH